jgi:hypothetical protein
MHIMRNYIRKNTLAISALSGVLIGNNTLANNGLIEFRAFIPASTAYSPLKSAPPNGAFQSIRSRSEWERLWATFPTRSLSKPKPAAPEVDFAKVSILVAAPDARKGNFSSVSFSTIAEQETTIIVTIIASVYGPNCTQIDSFSPISMVMIPATTKAIRFQVTRSTLDCGAFEDIKEPGLGPIG